jgi:hypothetical protein
LSLVELGNIGGFLEENKLKVNTKKNNFIVFKTHQNKPVTEPIIIYSEQSIENKISTQFLGIAIDQNLTWNSHVEKLLLKLNSGIYSLSRMSFFCNKNTLKDIYFANIHSHLAYGLCLYGSTTKTNMDQILKLQKKLLE